MGRRHFKPEQIIHMLREAEIKLAGGKTTGEVCRELGISEQSFYRWRKEYGGMQVSQARKLSESRGPMEAIAQGGPGISPAVYVDARPRPVTSRAAQPGGAR
jgi:transposase-like protein